MFGPTQLTHFIYVAIVVAFLLAVIYAVYYNLKMRARQKQLSDSNEVHNTPSSIVAAMESLDHDHDR